MIDELFKLIDKYPLLKSNTDIQSDRIELEKLFRQIKNKVQTIQMNCEHREFKKNYQYPGIFPSGGVLSKDCPQCGIHLEKPKGKLGEFCENCWSNNMEYLGQISGQGEHPSVYKCNVCEHETVIH